MAGDIQVRVRKIWPSRPRGRLCRIGDPSSYLILQIPALEKASAFFMGAQSRGPHMLSGGKSRDSMRAAGVWALGISAVKETRPCHSQQMKRLYALELTPPHH